MRIIVKMIELLVVLTRILTVYEFINFLSFRVCSFEIALNADPVKVTFVLRVLKETLKHKFASALRFPEPYDNNYFAHMEPIDDQGRLVYLVVHISAPKCCNVFPSLFVLSYSQGCWCLLGSSLPVLQIAAEVSYVGRKWKNTSGQHVMSKDRAPLPIDNGCLSARSLSSFGRIKNVWDSDDPVA